MAKETEQEHMDRLRAYRGLPPQREDDNLMLRTRAAVCLINSQNSEKLKMQGFLALFHPEIAPGSLQHIQLVQGVRNG